MVVLEGVQWKRSRMLECRMLLDRMAQSLLRHIFVDDLGVVVEISFGCIQRILVEADSRFAATLSDTNLVTSLHFAIPWLLTLFAHSLKEFHDVLYIYDYLIGKPPYVSLYVSAAAIALIADTGVEDITLINHMDLNCIPVRQLIEECNRLLVTVPASRALRGSESMWLKHYGLNLNTKQTGTKSSRNGLGFSQLVSRGLLFCFLLLILYFISRSLGPQEL